MTFGTWNVLTVRQPGKIQDLVAEAEKFAMDVIALQEIRWDDKGSRKFQNYTIFWSDGGQGKGHEFGTGFLVSNKVLGNVTSFDAEEGNRYLSKLRLKGRYRDISIICAHAPHEGISD
jgi:exonuclease III